MAPRHRRTTAVTTLAAAALVALAVPALTGCDTVAKAVDCARFAVDVTGDIDDLQRGLTNAAVNPDEADQALDALEKDIDKLRKHGDNADVDKAVDHLQKAVTNIRTAADKGETPDLAPLRDAAGELTDVCTPG
ncbi:hypothetical protein RKE29_23905 [Streptomyces sp. B1866]|uniref:hypothetical protein n=1 Tax=Streptomyces sp. B1866 TaxID=3075431 RepID=UPI0028922E92|nr:hypothetical protein [Streptomyces sp. B1866]MDT3399648.1 hypothetical protein [Streptomyces sp. B1866]